MPSRLSDSVFSEPSGRPITVVMLGGALVMSSGYLYYALLSEAAPPYLLVMAVGFALSGAAESLPADHRRAAGALRVTAIVLLLVLLALTVVAPDAAFGM
ncbi:hypothetical protein ACOZ4I_04000 [Haloarcula salina]|uniref:hypothetical protein n=1 Tax=Haloarcula salina TaxID=1429914 RepID=UPI003C6F85B0